MSKPTVLFVCSGNACRSQMAEAFLRKLGGDQFDAYSAGMEPQDIHPLTRKVMAEVGLDMKGQHAKGVKEYLGKLRVNHLIAVCANAAETCPKTWPGSPNMKIMVWPLEDPAAFAGTEEVKLAKFREIRDQIEAHIKAWLAEQETKIRSSHG